MGTLGALVSQLNPDDNLKGREWERVCKWFLTNDPVYRSRLRHVWLWNDWPGRWGGDSGIDLVAEDHEGGLWAIQAKAYAAKYSVKKADMDSFLSESGRPEFSFRLLIATTDRIGRTARRTIEHQEKPASVLMLADLQASGVEWPASPSSLRAPRPRRKRPRLHQREAINNVVKGFEHSDRGQMIMACGTGKTLTSLFLTEKLESRRTLVLLPSLSLLAQTIREWTLNASEEFSFLAVCSDESVSDSDETVSTTSDLGFPVTTEPQMIAAFLRRRSGKQVVLSTYQSSPQIAAAYRLGRVPRLDLSIADEAHRCAGPTSSRFATILHQEEIRSDRRLFMTATPRYFTGRVLRAGREVDLEVASMDDAKTFGPVFHRLGFEKAIKADLLSDYQVVVVGVDEGLYLDWVKGGHILQLKGGGKTDARTLAGQIALSKSIGRHNLRRVVSFHSRVKRAREFARTLPEVIDWMPETQRPSGSIGTDYVSGEMSAGERRIRLNRLSELEDCDRALVSNARCLAEGIDVPALDGVAFIDPRRSEVDIVQAVGRAIRKAPNKVLGTIIIPCFIATDEDPATALDDSTFKPIWDVIKALRAHDDVLAEELDDLRRELGRGRHRIDLPRAISVDLPERVGSQFASAFDVRLVERTTAEFEYGYGRLQRYIDEHQTARVPSTYKDLDGFALGAWCNSRRQERRCSGLDERRVQALDALSFEWDPLEADWQKGLAELDTYIACNGDALVPAGYRTPDGFSLGAWCNTRRQKDRRGALEAAHKAALKERHFEWDPREAGFKKGLRAFEQYVEQHGDHVPQSYRTPEGFQLGVWCANIRRDHRNQVLAQHRLDKLEDIGFVWDEREAKFTQGLEALEDYRRLHGDLHVPLDFKAPNGLALGAWCNNCRRRRRSGALPEPHVRALEKLGFDFDPSWSRFQAALNDLSEFVRIHEHSHVARGYRSPDGLALRAWCDRQRSAKASRRLDSRRVAALDDLNFIWDPKEAQFQEGLHELNSFLADHHGAMPEHDRQTSTGFRLGNWCDGVRQKRKRGTLGAHQINDLDAIGFDWSPRDTAFYRHVRALKDYAAEHQDALVPQRFVTRDGLRLGAWCNEQRQRRSRGKLDAARVEALDDLGFVWDPRAQARLG